MQLYDVVSIFTYGFSKLIPKKKNRWIFGAWFGNAVSDNTKALYDYVAEKCPDIERVWVVKDPSKICLPGCTIVKRNSLLSLKYILTAKVAVMNQGIGDISTFNFLGGTYKVQLWHGVAWKKIFRDAIEGLKSPYDKVFQLLNHYDLYIAPSDNYAKIVKSAFNTDDRHIILSGQPRNEVLFSRNYINESKKYVESRIGISGKKIVAYMPTFRDKTTTVFSFHKIEEDERFKKIADRYNIIIIEKLHYKNDQKSDDSKEDRLVYGLPDIDATALLSAADVLITDYSSCFFDYLILDRPIVHYIYDYDYYVHKDRGVYYKKEDVVCGSTAQTIIELLAAIESNLKNPELYHDLRMKRKEEFITYESSVNSERIVQRIYKEIR